MAGVNKRNRLSPPLMYAFRAAHAARDARKPMDIRDAEGERIISGRRASVRASITEPVLRAQVERDLGDLMNTSNLGSTEDLSNVPEVQRSILNFGIPDLSHRTMDDGDRGAIGREIERALVHFEPRLEPKTIRVDLDRRRTNGERLRFIVHADLRCDPVNLPLEFVADIEITTGQVKIDRL